MKTFDKFLTFLCLVAAIVLICVGGHIVSQYLPNSEDEIHSWQQRVKELEEEKQSQPDAARVAELEKALAASQKEAARVPELEIALADSQKEAAKVPKLEKKLSDSEKKLAKETSTSTGGNELLKIYKQVLDSLFPETKIPYEMRDENFEFYTDSSCDPAYLIKEPLTPVGYTDHFCEYFDEYDVIHQYYVSRCNQEKYNGGFVYSKQQPLFYPVNSK